MIVGDYGTFLIHGALFYLKIGVIMKNPIGTLEF